MKYGLRTAFFAVLTLCMMDVSFGQFRPKNDSTAAFVATTNSFGRIQSYDGTGGKFDNGNDKMIDRLYQLVGFSESYVWNPNDDPDINLVDTVFYASADSAAYFRHLVMDNSFRSSPPFDINVSTLVRMWEGDHYGLVRFGVRNTSDSPKTFKMSVLLRSKILNVFGGETLEWDNETLYAFNSSGAVGMKAVMGTVRGIDIMDFDDYDSTQPERDNARQRQRWDIMVKEEFPSSTVTAGADGGWAFMNFGDTPELAVGAEHFVWVAFTHGADLDEVDARLAQAVTRFGTIATSNERLENDAPKSFELLQNFPNPFNPSTNIQYSIKESAHVSLEVYTMLGQKVATLVNGMQVAGQHTAIFTANNLTSGMYLYRLNVNGQSEVRKMMLVK